MRKVNGILSGVVLVLFLIHAILGFLNLTGVVVIILNTFTRIMASLVIVHGIISMALTARAFKAWSKTGSPYFKENALFWARRISGLCIIILIFFHMTSFGKNTPTGYELYVFNVCRLTTNILLVLSVAVHVITNVKPMLITFGIRKLRPRAGVILFALSVLLILFAIGFIIYFIRWNTV